MLFIQDLLFRVHGPFRRFSPSICPLLMPLAPHFETGLLGS
jgi:hypothetical protein